MANIRTIPAKDADFNVWQELIATAIEENTSNWMLDTGWIENNFKPACTEWNRAWEKYENPATRTPLINAAKKEKRAIYEKLLKVIVANLKVNTRLTDDDRRALGINIRDTKPTPMPVPMTYPIVVIDTSTMRRLSISFRDSESRAAAKPKGVHGAEIRWAIIDDVKPTVEDLINSDFDTRSPHMLEFTEVQRGKSVWICLRWENTRGEKGPWGDIERAIIP